MRIVLFCRLCVLAVFVVLAGCTSLPRNPVPIDRQNEAKIPGLELSRAISGQDNLFFEEDALVSEQQYREHNGHSNTEKLNLSLLVLSGGADYGAFGAGLLNGWSESGKRPQFKLVTGVSTGALIATFAFLGPAYDQFLKEAYTTVEAEDIFSARYFSFLWKDSLVDTTPLAGLIRRFITDEVMQEVAEAHTQGRRLWIATTNLDADRLVIWNMGKIAQSGHPDALEIFHKIVLASTSIPGIFPPVMIDVDVDGQVYDEMHVDGGVKAQLFLNAETMNLVRLKEQYDKAGVIPKWTVYIVRNAKVGPEPQHVPRKLSAISTRAMNSLLKSQGRNDMERIFVMGQRAEIEFNWTSLPREYIPATQAVFDRGEMNNIYKLGYERGLRGGDWRQRPPGLGQN